MATTVGETGADFLASTINPIVAYALISICFLAALFAEFRSGRYVPWLYWLNVVFISVVGTLMTDALTDGLDISLFASTAVFSILLTITFIAWYAIEKTLSISSIYTARRERFYWVAILFTFALGTAAGDLTAEQLHLGYGISVFVFGAIITAVTVAYYLFRTNVILVFWIAYILTRPLGASLGDLLSQAKADGGFGLGSVGTSAFFLSVIVGLVAFLTVIAKKKFVHPSN